MSLFKFIFSNDILNCAWLGWFVAQFLKGIFAAIFKKKFTLERFLGSGGMPSSHGAFVSSLLVAVFLYEGWDSPYFAISVVLAFIVVYDASGVRYAVGEQAKVLNEINERTPEEERFFEKKFQELVGHTRIECAVGCILGAGLAVLYYFIKISLV